MDARSILDQLGITPKKSLGQNFMVEPAALARVADAADLTPHDAVLEIGAGLGALTDVLAARARRVIALEIDARLMTWLYQRFEEHPRVEVVQADILETGLGALLGDDADAYKAVANIPYYITSAIIRHLLESETPPALIVLTVQREVARRMAAHPGEMSLLAVSMQVYGQVSITGRLKAGVFYPRPDVESAIVRIAPHADGPRVSPEARAGFFRIVKAGFSQKRKQIKNSLRAGLQLPPDQLTAWLGRAQLDPRRRPETLTLDEWLTLHRTFDA